MRTDAIPVLQRQRHAQATGERQQVDHRIGRAADGGIGADGVGEGGAREHLRHAQVLAHHLDDAAARQVRQAHAARVHRGNRGVLRQRHAQCLDHARHGRGGAHGHAAAARALHAGLGLGELGLAQRAGAHHLGHLDDSGAGAHGLAAPVARQRRAAGHADGRQVDAGRAHQQRWGGLVAAHQQHHAVDGIGADRFLDIHAGEIAEQHGGGPHLGLAQRHHREFQRKPAGLVHAALDVLGEVAE